MVSNRNNTDVFVKLNPTVAFLPFHLEATFIAAVSLVMTIIVDNKLVTDARSWLKKAYSIFDELIHGGNLIAQSQKKEVIQLEYMFDELFVGPQPGPDNAAARMMSDEASQYSATLSVAPGDSSARSLSATQNFQPAGGSLMDPLGPMLDDAGMDDLFTGEQIMDIANLVDVNDVDWISQVITNHELW